MDILTSDKTWHGGEGSRERRGNVFLLVWNFVRRFEDGAIWGAGGATLEQSSK